MEWYRLPLDGKLRKAALIQVAFRDEEDNPTVLLVHLASFHPSRHTLPPALNAFLYCSKSKNLELELLATSRSWREILKIQLVVSPRVLILEKPRT
jgi:hypothetical protein